MNRAQIIDVILESGYEKGGLLKVCNIEKIADFFEFKQIELYETFTIAEVKLFLLTKQKIKDEKNTSEN